MIAERREQALERTRTTGTPNANNGTGFDLYARARAGKDDGGASKREAAAAARDADTFTTTNDDGEEQSFTRAEAAAAVNAGFDGDYQNAATPEEAAKRLAEAVRQHKAAQAK